MNAFAWLLTYALPLALIANGTLNQGDDNPWCFSLFYLSPLVAVGCLTLSLRVRTIRRFRWMSLFHLVTIFLAAIILPNYWMLVTIAQDHIGAAFDSSIADIHDPEAWHAWWAPIMTVLMVWVVCLIYLAFRASYTKQKIDNTR
jgi:hypothetical protein